MCHITKPKEEYQSQYGLNQKKTSMEGCSVKDLQHRILEERKE